MRAEIDELRTLISHCERALVFTGAGMSTESGIPDFRGPQGLWKHVKPIQFQDFVASNSVRQQYWRQWSEHSRDLLNAEPNSGHRVVADLVSRGKVAAVITQNVDGLHQDSGIDAQKVIELHGNATYAKCLQCETRVELSDIAQQVQEEKEVEDCAVCGGIIKTATISFGQQMPELPMQRAAEELAMCDLFIVLGSSLTVQPAAAFPRLAKEQGARLVIVNNEPTELDSIADLVVRQSIGEVMASVV